jgi:hypothetical protein
MFHKTSLLFFALHAVAIVSAATTLDAASYNIKDQGFRLGQTVPKSIQAHQGEAHDRLVSVYNRDNSTGSLVPLDVDSIYEGYYHPNTTDHEKRQFEVSDTALLHMTSYSNLVMDRHLSRAP